MGTEESLELDRAVPDLFWIPVQPVTPGWSNNLEWSARNGTRHWTQTWWSQESPGLGTTGKTRLMAYDEHGIADPDLPLVVWSTKAQGFGWKETLSLSQKVWGRGVDEQRA